MNITSLFRSNILNYQVTTRDLGDVRYVNLDNAATTPPFASVEQKVQDYLTSYGSVHRGAGTKSKVSTDEYERSREVIKRFVNAPEDAYVIYTGNTTGAMNVAAHFFSFLKGNVAVSAIEHSSSWLPWITAEGTKHLDYSQGTLEDLDRMNEEIQKYGNEHVLRYDVNENFEFDFQSIETILQERDIKVLVVTASSNITGYCPDIQKIGELAHRYGAYFMVDACQFIQHHEIDMQKMGIDFLVASGHKFYAPYGGGFLIGPKSFLDRFLPYQIGGGNLPYITDSGRFLRYKNQLAHDPGTPNAVGAVAMAAALEQIQTIGLENIKAYEQGLTRQAYDALAKNPYIRLYIPQKHLNTILLFSIEGMTPKETAETLNERFGIGVRAGSFCVYHMVRNLLSIKDESDIIAKVEAGEKGAVPGFVRASISLANTQEDIDRFIHAIEIITTERNPK